MRACLGLVYIQFGVSFVERGERGGDEYRPDSWSIGSIITCSGDCGDVLEEFCDILFI